MFLESLMQIFKWFKTWQLCKCGCYESKLFTAYQVLIESKNRRDVSKLRWCNLNSSKKLNVYFLFCKTLRKRLMKFQVKIQPLKFSNHKSWVSCLFTDHVFRPSQPPFTCSKSTTETVKKVWNMLNNYWRHSGIFIVNFDRISHLSLVFLLLTLNK